MEEILKRFNPWWSGTFHSEGVRRRNYLDQMRKYLDWPQVIFLVGLRRVGKTTLMKQFIEERLETVDSEKILYASLDHPEFNRISIIELIDAYRNIHGISYQEPIEVYLDEVHLHDGFERDLKVIHDMGNTKIFASGSASIFLIEKGSYLTGRQHFIEINPFDLVEYMDLLDIQVQGGNLNLMVKYAQDHMRDGGLPVYLKLKDPGYITDLVNSIIYKDIVSRHPTPNVKMLKDLVLLLSQNVGNRMSARKIGRVLGISHQATLDYISYFIETKMIDLVEKEGKVSERKASPKKVYFVDNGIINILAPTLNQGAMVENMVYNRLKRDGEPRYLIKNGKEVDFVMGDIALEVKYRDRITKDDLGPILALDGYGRKYVISKNYSGEIDGVKIIPFHRFLIEDI